MLTQLSPPSAEPLSLADAKLHLRVDADITEDDGLIAALIVTARQQAGALRIVMLCYKARFGGETSMCVSYKCQ